MMSKAVATRDKEYGSTMYHFKFFNLFLTLNLFGSKKFCFRSRYHLKRQFRSISFPNSKPIISLKNSYFENAMSQGGGVSWRKFLNVALFIYIEQIDACMMRALVRLINGRKTHSKPRNSN